MRAKIFICTLWPTRDRCVDAVVGDLDVVLAVAAHWTELRLGGVLVEPMVGDGGVTNSLPLAPRAMLDPNAVPRSNEMHPVKALLYRSPELGLAGEQLSPRAFRDIRVPVQTLLESGRCVAIRSPGRTAV